MAEEIEALGFRFDRFQTLEFRYQSPEAPVSEGDELGFRFGLEVGLSEDVDQAKVRVQIAVDRENDEGEPLEIARIRTEATFSISGAEKLGEASRPEGHSLPRPVVVPLTSISISTTRGVLLEKAAGTQLSDVVVPIVDPTALVEGLEEDRESLNGEMGK